jgi:hypothetical protein
MENTLIHAIASAISTYQAGKSKDNADWQDAALTRLNKYQDMLPRGSGFDAGTSIDLFKSTDDKIVFNTAFHHMNDAGYYDGWTDHVVTMRPSFVFGTTIAISGKDRRGIKEYMHEVFHNDLMQVVKE